MDACFNSFLLTVNMTHGRFPPVYGQGERKDNETEGRELAWKCRRTLSRGLYESCAFFAH